MESRPHDDARPQDCPSIYHRGSTSARNTCCPGPRNVLKSDGAVSLPEIEISESTAAPNGTKCVRLFCSIFLLKNATAVRISMGALYNSFSNLMPHDGFYGKWCDEARDARMARDRTR
jgi:hypothetical protein